MKRERTWYGKTWYMTGGMFSYIRASQEPHVLFMTVLLVFANQDTEGVGTT